MIRSMLDESGLSAKFWGEAAQTACYLQNRLPCRVIEKTPYELWENDLPNLKDIHVFGCKTETLIPEQLRGKLDPKTEKLIFVGYSDKSKGFRLLDPKTKKVKISRDVVFIDEHTYKQGNKTKNTPELDIQSNCYNNVDPQLEEENTAENPSVDQEINEIQIPEEPENLEDQEEENSEAETSDGDTITAMSSSTEGQSSTSSYHSSSDTELYSDSFLEDSDEERPPRTSSRESKGQRPKRYPETTRSITEIIEPRTIKEALGGKESKMWKTAMEDEIKSLNENKTWELVDLPSGGKAIGSKWVFKIKEDESRENIRFKSRLVAQGFSQKFGVDYD